MKAPEKIFIVVCVVAAVAASISAYISLDSPRRGVRVFSEGSAEAELYDVSVINEATADDFMHIDGIGEVRAGDIIAYRNAVGGFSNVSQLKDIAGISDAIYQRIIEWFYLSSAEASAETSATEMTAITETEISEAATNSAKETEPLKTSYKSKTEAVEAAPPDEQKTMHSVNINSASADEIEQALMIDSGLAEEIVTLRDNIQYFSQVQELYLCESMKDEIYRRIKDYILFE